MIRNVSIIDAKQILDIYNYYVTDTIVTFEENPVSIEIIVQRIQNIIDKNFPYIVYEKEGVILAYGYVNQAKAQSAYHITLETSIYVKNGMHKMGLGKLLYTELIDRVKNIESIHSLIAVLAVPNLPSQKLHERLGFKRVGTWEEVGKKFGKLLDVEFWQLKLQ